jgi:hypothetical protein
MAVAHGRPEQGAQPARYVGRPDGCGVYIHPIHQRMDAAALPSGGRLGCGCAAPLAQAARVRPLSRAPKEALLLCAAGRGRSLGGGFLVHVREPLGPLHTRAKSRDHEIVRAQMKVSKGHRSNTPPKSSCSVVTGPRVYCEVICDRSPRPNASSMIVYSCRPSHMIK